MTRRSLQAVLRKFIDAAPAASDDDLVRRFQEGDEDAFAELVRRHGRLVWSVCRHLTGCDAEADDAFQATFLILLRNAGKIRDAGRLSAWLHGVAYRVCAKSRLSAKRRTARERAVAAYEGNGVAVADSAWDRALAAVHEEVAKLPETLRVPFVLCCLEGKGVSESAAELGWKLGTFSGRLTRAKDALVARLDARGLTLGAVAGLGLAAPPAAAVAKAVALAKVGFAIPSSVLQLTQGVIGMSMKSTKLLAAAVIVTCGLGMGLGSAWMASADAQPPAKKKVDPADEIKRLQAELDAARRAAERAQKEAIQERELIEALRQKQAAEAERAAFEQRLDALNAAAGKLTAKSSKWEYDFVAVSDMTQAKFVEFLRDREGRGWEYNGMTRFRDDGKLADLWVFRRPAKGSTLEQDRLRMYRLLEELRMKEGDPAQSHLKLRGYLELNQAERRLQDDRDAARLAVLTDAWRKAAVAGKAEDAKRLADEIAALKEQLATLKGKPARDRVVLAAKDLPLDAKELTEILLILAGKKFKDGQYSFTPARDGLTIEGDKDVVSWAVAIIKTLGDKSPSEN